MSDDSRPVSERWMGRFHPGLFLLILLPYAFLVRKFWFVADDAFISFRYSQNLARGHGLRYNLGSAEPVEGYSNFLWVLICSIFEFFRLEITIWPLLLSTACGVAVLWLVFELLHRRFEVGLTPAFLATLSLACYPPFALWSTGGLATMPFALAVLLTFERLVLRRAGPDVIGGSLCGLILALLRLEGIAWFAVILILALISRRLAAENGRRALLKCALIVAAGFASYYIWRSLYYGMPLPNTAYAKAELDAPRLLRGLKYVGTHLLTFVTPLLIIPASIVALRRGRRPVGLPLVALAIAFPAYSILVTGDFMPMGRFLLPAISFQTLLLGWLLHDLWIKGTALKSVALSLAAATILIQLLPAFNLHIVPNSIRSRLFYRYSASERLSEYEAWEAQVENTRQWGLTGKALANYTRQRTFDEDHPTYVKGAIGAIGYYSGLDIFDWHGLVTPRVAHRSVGPDEPLRSPGHDKQVDVSFFGRDEPTIFMAKIDLEHPNTPQHVARLATDASRNLRGMQDRNRIPANYVTDVARVDDTASGNEQYLVTWVRLPAGDTLTRARAEFQNRIQTLASGRHFPPIIRTR